jgi:hypothetical protein
MQSQGFFHNVWERWKQVAKKIGDFQARLLLTIFYLLIIGPFALLIRLWGDPLGIKPRSPRGWLPHSERKGAPIERASQQF